MSTAPGTDSPADRADAPRRARHHAQPVLTPDDREQVLSVLRAVYDAEKGWTAEPESQFPAEDLDDSDIAWFMASYDGETVGVMRVLYRLPFELYGKYGFQLVDPSIDVEAFLREHDIAEIGRFAVVTKHRGNVRIATALMSLAVADTIDRGFTHYLTDAFEEDPNSPLGFHRRVLGFEVVATHDVGELNAQGRRITMLLDLRAAFMRMRKEQPWIYRQVTRGWDDSRLDRLLDPDAAAPVEQWPHDVARLP
ncbi:MAG: GNAT family N-acetyltransferase [Acidobacteriota bacterium]